VHDIAAGHVAAARLRPQDELGSAAFKDDMSSAEAATLLAVIVASATPLSRATADDDQRALRQKFGQVSTHLFQLQLPSGYLATYVQRYVQKPSLYYLLACAAAAEDVSLGRAMLRWRRKAPDGAPPMPTATSSCDLPVLTVQVCIWLPPVYA
jgi:hypothetical protein